MVTKAVSSKVMESVSVPPKGKGADNALNRSQREVQDAIRSTVEAEVTLIRAKREERSAWEDSDDTRLGAAVRKTADAKTVAQAQREGLAIVVKNAHKGIHVDLPNGSRGINYSGLMVWINGDSLLKYARSIA